MAWAPFLLLPADRHAWERTSSTTVDRRRRTPPPSLDASWPDDVRKFADQELALTYLATAGTLYLDQVQGGLRVVSTREQVGAAMVYARFSDGYPGGRLDRAAAAMKADFEAAIPELDQMLWLQVQTAHQ